MKFICTNIKFTEGNPKYYYYNLFTTAQLTLIHTTFLYLHQNYLQEYKIIPIQNDRCGPQFDSSSLYCFLLALICDSKISYH